MKRVILTVVPMLAAALLVINPVAQAQDCGCSGGGGIGSAIGGGGFGLGGGLLGGALGGGSGVYNSDGMIVPNAGGVPPLPQKIAGWALQDSFSPNPVYAYSYAGVESGLTYEWNRQKEATTPWNANYNYWRFNAPTALVVPPTAAFESHYAWGVGQTRSRPIYHQFGRGLFGGGGGGFGSQAPYWPTNTGQSGVYSVRAPF